MSDNQIFEKWVISAEIAGKRLDQAVTEQLKNYSRSRIQDWILQGWVTVNGLQSIAKHRVEEGECIIVDVTLEPEIQAQAQAIPLDIIFENENYLVINKPAGLVVHPGAGITDGTLMNAVLYHVPRAKELPRAGIVHRLDKDTTGLMVIAKTLESYHDLVQALQRRDVKREYYAIANGVMTGGGKVEEPIGRHPKNRLKMAVQIEGREAITHYRIKERFRGHTAVDCQLETGRTHQIRVHLESIGYPLLGDPLYGPRVILPKNMQPEHRIMLQQFKRQALHAVRLAFTDFKTGELLQFEIPLPEDLQQLIETLRKDKQDDEKSHY